ncbi:uncharacterized protein VTP21DRAFT_3779 [Calcarisporiella thermophila]|uniref:uncharacterized protein n=1 Tax=Calcarisporiella thermophila TaxID=911321 RepID=UPI0037432560
MLEHPQPCRSTHKKLKHRKHHSLLSYLLPTPPRSPSPNGMAKQDDATLIEKKKYRRRGLTINISAFGIKSLGLSPKSSPSSSASSINDDQFAWPLPALSGEVKEEKWPQLHEKDHKRRERRARSVTWTHLETKPFGCSQELSSPPFEFDDNARRIRRCKSMENMRDTSSNIVFSPVIDQMIHTRRYNFQELLTTERTFHQHLLCLHSDFYTPFRNTLDSRLPLISRGDVDTIFSHLDKLLQLSEELLGEFERTMEEFPPASSYYYMPAGVCVEQARVAQVFLRHKDKFSVFADYARNYPVARQALRRPAVAALHRRLLSQATHKTGCGPLKLTDYLIEPVQRITRYLLLVRKLREVTPTEHPDWKELGEVIAFLDAIALMK